MSKVNKPFTVAVQGDQSEKERRAYRMRERRISALHDPNERERLFTLLKETEQKKTIVLENAAQIEESICQSRMQKELALDAKLEHPKPIGAADLPLGYREQNIRKQVRESDGARLDVRKANVINDLDQKVDNEIDLTTGIQNKKLENQITEIHYDIKNERSKMKAIAPPDKSKPEQKKSEPKQPKQELMPEQDLKQFDAENKADMKKHTRHFRHEILSPAQENQITDKTDIEIGDTKNQLSLDFNDLNDGIEIQEIDIPPPDITR